MANSDHTDHSTVPREVTRDAEFNRIINHSRRVLVEFYADWCVPCQEMQPMVRAIAAETGYPVVTIDVEAAAPIAAKHDVDAVPTFLLFEGGTPTDRVTGIQDRETLEELLTD